MTPEDHEFKKHAELIISINDEILTKLFLRKENLYFDGPVIPIGPLEEWFKEYKYFSMTEIGEGYNWPTIKFKDCDDYVKIITKIYKDKFTNIKYLSNDFCFKVLKKDFDNEIESFLNKN